MTKRLLIYSHDTFGLGNIRRMLEIANFLAKEDAEMSILVVSGSPMLHAFRIPERVDYIKLPCLRRTLDGEYSSKSLELDYDELIRLRANLLLSAILDFQPDLMLVDKKPFGVSNELEPALDLLRRRMPKMRVVLLLRDILDSPERTKSVWRKNGYFEAVERYYDQVLVVGSRRVFDITSEYEFPEYTRQKIVFCGYIRRRCKEHARATIRSSRQLQDQDRLVLITVGGGEDGYSLLSAYLSGIEGRTDCAHHSLLVCGPEMRAAQRDDIFSRAAQLPKVSVLEFSDDLIGLMDAADLVVCMGGYNTTCELLSLRKRAVIVPRTRPVLEQWIRAERLKRLGIFRALHPDHVTPDSLLNMIDEELGRANIHPSTLYQVDMDGLPRIAQEIRSQLNLGHGALRLAHQLS